MFNEPRPILTLFDVYMLIVTAKIELNNMLSNILVALKTARLALSRNGPFIGNGAHPLKWRTLYIYLASNSH